MIEQRFFHSPQRVHVPPLAPILNRTEIQINWKNEVVKTIKIRHCPIEMATKVYCINLKSVFRRGHGAQLALEAEPQKIFHSRLGRRTT